MDDLNRVEDMLPEFEEIIKLGKLYQKQINNGVKDYEVKKRLEEYLNKFDYLDVALIMSVMYLGRDEYIPRERYENIADYYRDIESFYEQFDKYEAISDMFNYIVKHGDSQITMISQILSKSPFPNYLEQGLDVLRVKRIER